MGHSTDAGVHARTGRARTIWGPVRLPRSLLILTLVLGTTAALATPARAEDPKWVQRIDDVVGRDPVSVVIGYSGDVLYHYKDWVARPPASNEKLLLSMALLNRVSPTQTIPTRVLSTRKIGGDGVLRGNLWIVGHGDPEIAAHDMGELAQALRARGLRRVRGRVLGATGPFSRDWWAHGWKNYFPTYYIARPTALTFRFNVGPGGRHIRDPERRAALALTGKLRGHGIRVSGKPGMGSTPRSLHALATIKSDQLRHVMHRMNMVSSNFRAEVLGKYLGARVIGSPGSIARGAKAIRRFAGAHNVHVTAYDASGLSYANRVTAKGIVHLLWVADAAPWGVMLRNTLARGGQGTLEDRLEDVRVRAKTGTLDQVSALSGWVWLEREDAWAEFSILSRGISKTRSIHIENAIVRVVSANAGPR
jgi:D-alanyl-D-alanine carboxypeptidase/D-alanyl-D-alanine-endopeptidase (penicillin-binding protein 4)